MLACKTLFHPCQFHITLTHYLGSHHAAPHQTDAGTPPMEHTPHLEPARRSKRMHLANYPSCQTDAARAKLMGMQAHHIWSLNYHQSKADGVAKRDTTNTPSGAIMQHYARAKLMQPTPILPTSCSLPTPHLGCRTQSEQKRNIPPPKHHYYSG